MALTLLNLPVVKLRSVGIIERGYLYHNWDTYFLRRTKIYLSFISIKFQVNVFQKKHLYLYQI